MIADSGKGVLRLPDDRPVPRPPSRGGEQDHPRVDDRPRGSGGRVDAGGHIADGITDAAFLIWYEHLRVSAITFGKSLFDKYSGQYE